MIPGKLITFQPALVYDQSLQTPFFVVVSFQAVFIKSVSRRIRQEVVRQLSGSHQAVVRQSSGSRQAVVRQSSGSRQAVVRQSSGSRQAVVR